MAVEIERKFLVAGGFPSERSVPMVQGYLNRDLANTVRVRTEGNRAVITIKGLPKGIARQEFEYEIPLEDARELFKMAVGPLVEKTRHYHRAGPHVWEIDVFHGANAGLVVAEIELESEHEDFEKPDWLGAEVTGDARYTNSSLSSQPFCAW